jgi:hypothetical protein
MFNYEDKYVIYFDILGFKVLIKEKTCEEIYRILENTVTQARKSNCLDILLSNDKGYLDIEIENGDIKTDFIVGDANMTYCSDSVFISLNKDTSCLCLLKYISAIQLELLKQGILIRGGLSYGATYHKENMIFGPAVVLSVESESKIKNPFICLDSSVITVLSKNDRELFNKYIKHDENGNLFVDFLECYYCSLEYYRLILKVFNEGGDELQDIILNLKNKAKNQNDQKILDKLNAIVKFIENFANLH